MKKLTTFLLGFLVCLNISLACINDSASKTFEMQPFPNEEQLIAGSFHVHSKEFYEWRIKDRLKKLKKDPDNPALLDDLSVSYEKTGQTQLAIDTLQSVLHTYPNRYETLANLGTFYIHHQEYHKGLELLKKAIKINPEAHYGREIYQIKVVEYLLSLNKKPPFVFPIQKDKDFSDFLLRGVAKDNQKDELIRAIVGVSGMLKFGNSDSPILLEVLGDLYLKVSNNYAQKPYFQKQNPISDLAKKFYIAAFIKSNLKDETIIYKFLESKPEFAFEPLVDEYYNYNYLNSNFKQDIKDIQNNIESALKNKKLKIQEEIKIINTSENPEKDIYSYGFEDPKLQQDLFKNKNSKINLLLQYINLEYKTNVIEFIGYNIFQPMMIVLLLFIGCLFNLVYFKNRKNTHLDNDLKTIITKIKPYIVFYNFSSLFIISFIVALILEIYELIFMLLSPPMVLCCIISTFTIKNIIPNRKEVESNSRIIRIMIISKKTLYYCCYAMVLSIIITKIWVSNIESNKTHILNMLEQGSYTTKQYK